MHNEYADLLLDPVWVGWVSVNKDAIDKLIEMYYINPSNVLRYFSREGQEVSYAELGQLIECLEATLNQIEK